MTISASCLLTLDVCVADRYVVVGAPRSALPGQSQDVVASTSVLAQLAQSIHFIHSQHKWKPRRGVKLISWGGAEFSSSGMLYYIMVGILDFGRRGWEEFLSGSHLCYTELLHFF